MKKIIFFLTLFPFLAFAQQVKSTDDSLKTFFPNRKFVELPFKELIRLYNLPSAQRLKEVRTLGLKESPAKRTKDNVCYTFLNYFIEGDKMVSIVSCKNSITYLSKPTISIDDIKKQGFELFEKTANGNNLHAYYFNIKTVTECELEIGESQILIYIHPISPLHLQRWIKNGKK